MREQGRREEQAGEGEAGDVSQEEESSASEQCSRTSSSSRKLLSRCLVSVVWCFLDEVFINIMFQLS